MYNIDNYSHEYKTRRILDLDKILLQPDDMALPEEEDPAEVLPHDDDPAEDLNLVKNTGVEQHEMGDVVPECEVVEIPGVDTQSDDGNDETDVDDHDSEEQTDQNNQWYELRTKRGQSYTHRYDPDSYVMMSSGSTDGPLATLQVSLKKGMKMCGHDGLAPVKKEMQQLHDRTVMKPQTGKDLTPDEKCMALAYLMFLKL